MKKLLKIILWIAVIVFIIIQFFSAEQNTSSMGSTHHISKKFPVPLEVQNIFNKSCNDCHSNNTRYPWYALVQPVGWFLDDHINEGKEEINFDEFAQYSPRRQYRKFYEIKKQIEEAEMPLTSYLLLHPSAKLSEEQKQTLIGWSVAMQNKMKSEYPIDSLERKKK